MLFVRVLVTVCACAALASGVVLPTSGHDPQATGAVLRRRLRDAPADASPAGAAPLGLPPAQTPPQEAADSLDDLARKKKVKKSNSTSTVGQEVFAAIVDGLSGESEDAKFGSEIRKEFGVLLSTVTKLGPTIIGELVSGDGARSTARMCADQGGDCRGRGTRAVDNVGEGRKRQVRRLLVRYLVLLKVFALGIILPGAVLLSLLQSWKAVTLSLMALLLAGVIGVRGLVSTAAKGQPAEVIHSSPGGHYWRRISPEQGQDGDRLAYGAYNPTN